MPKGYNYRVGDKVKVEFQFIGDKILEIRMVNTDTKQYLAYDLNGDNYVIVPTMIKELLND